MPTNLWGNTVTQLFQEHKMVCNYLTSSCSHIFFRFKSLSRQSRNDRISASLIQLSVNVFSVWQGADGRGHHWPLKETWQTAGWLSRSRLQDSTCQFRNFTTYSQFYWLNCITHMTTRVPRIQASIQCFVVLEATVQHITNHLVKCTFILMVQSSLLVFGPDIFICSDKIVPNTGENAWGSEWRNR